MKAPISLPNNSLSIKLVGGAAQVTVISGRSLSKAHIVDGGSNQLFSCTGFPEDEDRGVRRSNLLCSIEDTLETITLSENMAELMFQVLDGFL